MMKILSATQIKSLDKATIEGEPIQSIDLMERASLAFVRWFVRNFDFGRRVGVVCATGNNGGDGLAIARLLAERHYNVSVWIVRGGAPETDDFKTNLIRLAAITPVTVLESPPAGIFENVNVLIDALFGSGLSRPLEGVYADTVSVMNQSPAVRVAVDIPSGLMCDKHSVGEIVRADFTISFQLPKLAFFVPENGDNVGDWDIVDIGLSQAHIDRADSCDFLITDAWIRRHMPSRKKFSHKGNFGKALLVAGSFGKMGAAVLAARATMRSGAGLLTVHVPACGYEIIQTAVPEAMASVDESETYVSDLRDLESFDCIGVGPGIGTEKQTAKVVERVLKSGKPVVVDADGLNILSIDGKLMKLLHQKAILTPHPGEFRRLVGNWSNDFERLALQRKLSRETGATVILKGAHTSITTPDGNTYFNSTGNPGMATGGSGDVLTGMLTGLLAQGLDSGHAAILGVYLHGKAGDMVGRHPLIASDIVDTIPGAFKSSLL